MIRVSNRFISVTKPFPCITALTMLHNTHEQITWRDNINIFYIGMYTRACSSVSTFQAELIWS